jgi:hypothetical protein
MPPIIPRTNNARVAWVKHFKSRFAENAASFNVGAGELAKVEAACDTIVFATQLAADAKRFARACNKFRDRMLAAKDFEAASIPKLTPLPAPAVLSAPNALGYLQKVIRWLKVQPNYSETIGLQLGIVARQSSFSAADVRPPKFKGRALANSVVRLDWRKGKSDGVIVYGQYTDTQWTEIGRDSHPPFIDTRPPREAGKPELRRYRMRYMLKDEPVGELSYIVEVSTIP